MSSPPDSVSAANPRPPYVLWAALALASALVVALGWQLMRLREDQRWLVDRVNLPYVGMFVPQVAATALDGRAVALGQPHGQRQVLFFFNTTCPHCRASLPQLKLAARELRKHAGVELVGVAFATPAQTAAYAREHALDFPLIAVDDDRRTQALFRARRVPSLLVIGGDGRVRYQRVGELNGKTPLHELLRAATAAEPPAATREVSPKALAAR
ncbi:TlpA family protein disulfide reductase [Lysobacter sp. K5869]|uniref:peroxiredoxin family protein n=1 Tax=Lysobacter sp. K5869 TaxID=2820808 RepID=UPI001C0647F7|nr:TlpA disulfide reductase family protein [Lysobacter sp. K5869]QWP76205.1 TlpA family protein disulfide reductase [Lysobacter sp. K5869]